MDDAHTGGSPHRVVPDDYSWLAGNGPGDAADQAIAVLSLEYQTLRAEILARSASRFQFLAGSSAVATLVAGAIQLSPHRRSTWLIVTFAAVLLAAGLTTFTRMGQHIVSISERLSAIEHQVNKIMEFGCGVPFKLLRWESDHQDRRGLSKLLLGVRVGPQGQDIARARGRSDDSKPTAHT